MRLGDFKILSFDCYGTLIDWETGLVAALRRLLDRRPDLSRDAVLHDFAEAESAQEHETPRMLYRDILARVHARLAGKWGIETNEGADRAFGGSVGHWPAFADTPVALAYLKQHYKLVILSNVDRQSFAATNKRLGVAFDAICTAEEIGSYKPAPRNFEFLLARVKEMGLESRDLLHTAQSLYHDHAPANAFGIASCWINRRGDKGAGSGATKALASRPHFDFEFPTLAAMADAHRREVV